MTYRFANVSRNELLSVIADCRRFGRELARVLASRRFISSTHIVEIFRNFRDQERLLYHVEAAPFVGRNVFLCYRCGNVAVREYARDVRMAYTTELWCDECVSRHTFICDECGETCDDDIRRNVAPDFVLCESCVTEHTFVCCGCGGTYHNTDYASEGLCNYCYDSDDEEGSDDGLVGYHGTYRIWHVVNDAPNIPFKNSPAVGFELEVYAENRAWCVQSLLDLAQTDAYPFDLILERDESLDTHYGFEVITHPLGLTEHHRYDPVLLSRLRDNGAVGWDAPNTFYGIHVTVSRLWLSPLQEARMMMFFAAMENTDFVCAIAQRRNIYSAEVDIGALGKPYQQIRYISLRGFTERYYHSRRVKKISGCGKYAPINFKDDLAEFRIFHSTLDEVSFLKNIEFVYALIEWTSPETSTGSSWRHEEFLKWLRARPDAKVHYPNLLAYLERDSFPVKGYERIRNVWK